MGAPVCGKAAFPQVIEISRLTPSAGNALPDTQTLVPGWVGKLDRELLTEVPAAKLLPSIEVGPDGPQFPPMSPQHYESDLKAALEQPAGVVLYHLELLLEDAKKQAITKRLLAPRP